MLGLQETVIILEYPGSQYGSRRGSEGDRGANFPPRYTVHVRDP